MISCKFVANFQNSFPKNTSGGLLLLLIDTIEISRNIAMKHTDGTPALWKLRKMIKILYNFCKFDSLLGHLLVLYTVQIFYIGPTSHRSKNSLFSSEIHCVKCRNFTWCGNLVERYNFRIVSGDSPETMQRKLSLLTKFPHQEIM